MWFLILQLVEVSFEKVSFTSVHKRQLGLASWCLLFFLWPWTASFLMDSKDIYMCVQCWDSNVNVSLEEYKWANFNSRFLHYSLYLWQGFVSVFVFCSFGFYFWLFACYFICFWFFLGTHCFVMFLSYIFIVIHTGGSVLSWKLPESLVLCTVHGNCYSECL